MNQDLDWTLPDNSLNIKLYYKNHLQLIKKGNIKLSKSVIETLHDVIFPQSSSQLSSSCLSQSSMIKLSPPPSLTRSNIPSVQALCQSLSSHSLLTIATLFNPKCQNFLRNFHHPYRKDFPHRSI